jgi:hypothetical protein
MFTRDAVFIAFLGLKGKAYMETPSYDALLADLRTRRARLDAAISVIEDLVASGDLAGVATTSIGSPSYGANSDQEIPSDAFFGMTITDATKKYLGMVKKKQSTKQIMDALERGGMPHKAKKFYLTVYTTLRRADKAKRHEIVKVGNDWGLPEWYGATRGAEEGD